MNKPTTDSTTGPIVFTVVSVRLNSRGCVTGFDRAAHEVLKQHNFEHIAFREAMYPGLSAVPPGPEGSFLLEITPGKKVRHFTFKKMRGGAPEDIDEGVVDRVGENLDGEGLQLFSCDSEDFDQTWYFKCKPTPKRDFLIADGETTLSLLDMALKAGASDAGDGSVSPAKKADPIGEGEIVQVPMSALNPQLDHNAQLPPGARDASLAVRPASPAIGEGGLDEPTVFKRRATDADRVKTVAVSNQLVTTLKPTPVAAPKPPLAQPPELKTGPTTEVPQGERTIMAKARPVLIHLTDTLCEKIGADPKQLRAGARGASTTVRRAVAYISDQMGIHPSDVAKVEGMPSIGNFSTVLKRATKEYGDGTTDFAKLVSKVMKGIPHELRTSDAEAATALRHRADLRQTGKGETSGVAASIAPKTALPCLKLDQDLVIFLFAKTGATASELSEKLGVSVSEVHRAFGRFAMAELHGDPEVAQLVELLVKIQSR